MVVASTQLAHIAERHRRAGGVLDADRNRDDRLNCGDP
jgi:hypothetical protein